MLPFHWGLLGVALFVAFTHGASINAAAYDDDVEQFDEAQRAKRSYKRGQTQSQYLNFGQPELDGKAEAEATESGSRSTVSGTHGMGQAQSQFSSGDCSGCGVGSPVYEYSTGSPDPLTLNGNAIPYADGKPSSIIGLHGSSPVGAFGSDSSSFPHGSVGQAGRPGAGGAFLPSSGISSGQPGTSGSFSPAGPGAGSSFTPGVGGAGQLGRPGNNGALTPGGVYAPVVSGTGQIGRPGSGGSYAPGTAFAPGTNGAGQVGRPGAGSAYSPEYAPGVSGSGQIGKPGTSGAFTPDGGYSPGGSDAGPGSSGVYAPGIAGAAQAGRPGTGDSYAPGVAQTRRPGTIDAFVPGSGYAPGASTPGHIGQPGTSGDYTPGSGYVPVAAGEGQVGRPGTGGTYSPVSGYAPGVDIVRQPGRPGSSDAYAPGGGYAPGTSSGGQIGRPGAGGNFAPGSRYTPGTSGAGQTGTYAPHGVGQVGTPGTPFGYGPAAGSGGIGQQGVSGFTKPGVSGTGEQGREQDRPPHLIAPPMAPPGSFQGPQAGTSFGSQVPMHGRPGQQIPTYTPGASYSVPGESKQQIPQYGHGGQQLPAYGLDERRPGVVNGQPGQQIPGQKVSQPGPFYGPSIGYVPGTGTGHQMSGYPQQPGYAPVYTVPTAGGKESLPGGPVPQPGAHYSLPGPQQILQQPGQGTIPRPGAGGMQGVVISGPQPGSGLQYSYQPQPDTGYGQSASRIPTVQGAVYQPSGSFGQPGAVQQGRVLPSGGVLQPGLDQRSGGFMQPGVDQTAYAQPGSVQQVPSLQPPGSGRQPGSGPALPSSGIQPGTVYGPPIGSTQPGPSFGQPETSGQQGAGMAHGQQGLFTQPGGSQTGSGFEQTGTGSQPSSGQLVPGGGRPGTAVHQLPSGLQQVPGYATGYGQQGQPGAVGSYPQETKYGQPGPLNQPTDVQPGGAFGQYPGSGVGQGPLPASGVQHGAGMQQGSNFGTGYDATYTQPSSGQPGTGYGLIPGTAQNGYSGRGQAGDAAVRLPGSVVSQYGQGPQTIVQPGTTYIPGSSQASGVQQSNGALGGPASGVGEDAFSQAESSIGNGQAAASAQGKKNGGTAKTQVQGTYSSSGSFSASAMTSDNDRSASSQVTGGVEGAMSQSQGQGGAAQSQAQVQVNEKTGGTKASSQSGGIIHQSQSEVQANDKGGLADAQSSGPGQTSSQAQIGFRPGQDGEIVRSAGGGQASAQSGAHSGNSQSQIQGTSKYGVSYHGAAQSASGTKEQVATYREQNRDLFNTISQFGGTDAVTDRVDAVYTPGLTSESDIPDLQLKASRTNKEATNSNKLDDDSILTDEEDEEEPYDEYEDEEDYYNENPIKMESKTTENKKLETSSLYRTHTQKSPTQTQQVAVADPSKKYNVVQNQNGRVQTYPARTTTETVPNGFRGTVNVEKKFHTKSLEPHKTENKLNITADEKSAHKLRTPDSFVTVTKSITGSMDNSKNPPKDNKNFQSTYYTKSSTCGYFTFSCNIVYGANGRSKICRPKAPTNGKC